MTVENLENSVVLFMSVDIAGSTEFKAQSTMHDGTPIWLEAFETFFRDVPLVFMGQVGAAFMMEDETPDCGVWKVIGDEIVFKAHPKSEREAELLTIAFYRTLVKYDRKFFNKWPLRLRGCCWAAQMSGRNKAIEIAEMMDSKEGGIYVDFLGPDVDAGFRLAACVGRGQMIVSTNLAEILAASDSDNKVELYYVGRKVLKGVNKGRPYPLMLMAMKDMKTETWEWEEVEDEGLKVLRENKPMPSQEVLNLISKIRHYLNHMCHANIESLKF